MKLIEFEGKTYSVFSWTKPEDSDCNIGECCYAIYPAAYSEYPVLVMTCGDKKFKSLHKDIQVQPLFVLRLPPLDEQALIELPHIYSLIGNTNKK